MLLVLPILVPLATAALCLLFWRQVRLQRWMSLVSSLIVLGISVVLFAEVHHHGMQLAQMGGWPAPYGITVVADRLTALMVLATAFTSLVVNIYSLSGIDDHRQSFGHFALMHFLIMGVMGAFLTGDLFNLYVWFEVMLIASFVLMALGGERGQLEGAMKYVTLNLIASFLFLSAVGILYGTVGTLNLADAGRKLREIEDVGLTTTMAMFFLIAFGIKSALFPLYFWLPASYHTPPAAITAIFSALLTKVGLYALLRVFTLLFMNDMIVIQTVLLIVAGFTMVTGVLGTVAQFDFRRILAFHVVSQIGYILFGFALLTPLGIAGAIYFIIHQMVVKTNLFLICGVVELERGTGNVKALGGLQESMPGISLFFAISACSLAGIPPLTGFIGKLALIIAGFQAGAYIATTTAVGVSLLTLFSMSKIWHMAFWGEPSGAQVTSVPQPSRIQHLQLVVPIGVLSALTIGLGVFAQPIMAFVEAAAHDLLNPMAENGYVDNVLRDRQ